MCARIAREEFTNATDSAEPMKLKRQSGGTTEMKWMRRGTRIGFTRFSTRRATLETLKWWAGEEEEMVALGP